MALIAKKCSVCEKKLPDKRKYKGVCDFCGMNYLQMQKQLEDTLAIVDAGKNPRTCFDRCLFGLNLLERFSKFVTSKFGAYPRNMTHEEITQYFQTKCFEYADKIAVQNDKKKYPKKIGIPTIQHYKKLFSQTGGYKDGACKGCWTEAPINDAGYCHDCICRATMVYKKDVEEYAAQHSVEGLDKNQLVHAVSAWKGENARRDSSM